MSVLLVTSLGDIVVDLHTDLCPLTCKNFIKLCKTKYYNGCLFHTVQKDFTAQTGDPTGTGAGGDSIYKSLYGDQARFFGDEIRLDLKHTKIGTVAMASAGENLNASQFYITLRDDLDYLDGKHTVFGEVAEGLETLSRINEAYVDEKGRPYKNIRIKHTYVLDDPFEDPPQLVELIPDASPEGKPKDEVDGDVRLEDDWVPMDEQLGPSELEEVLRSKEAHSSAVVLESIGDIPDAEVKPPDNVLFVCKLNPVTEDEDLHTIFSRFGTVTSAEVIRDFKTGDSLCYAFIEFENKDACEQAYFKMDNALIDDRRIHVDFSQSVSKLWSQYRRKDNKMGQGGGCFKCGALDHIAKDCTGEPTIKQPSKYILKDDNTQRGGDDNSRYEMVFDGDTAASPKREKRLRDYESKDHGEKQKLNQLSSEDFNQRSHEKKDSSDRHRQNDRSREYRDHEKQNDGSREYREHEKQSDRSREYKDHEKQSDRSREYKDHEKQSDRSREYREHERSWENRTSRTGGSKRDNDRRDDRDSRKRDWRYEKDHRKRSGDGEERNNGKSTERDDVHDRYRDRDSRHRSDKRR